MSTAPPPLDYERRNARARRAAGIRWLFLVISIASLLSAVLMTAVTLPARGWDQFAYAMIDRVLLAAQVIALGATVWYAIIAPHPRGAAIIVAVVIGCIGLAINLFTVASTW